jgi:hypothetical protein
MTDPRPRSRIFVAALVPLAVGVAVLLIVLRVRLQPPTLPAYVIAGTPPSEPIDVTPGGSFAIELRPVAAVDGAVSGRGFLLRGNEVLPWNPPVDVTRNGWVRIQGPVDRLFATVPPGRWEVAVAVGRPEVLPTAPLDVLRARDDDRPLAWHLVRETIELEPARSTTDGPEAGGAHGMHGP